MWGAGADLCRRYRPESVVVAEHLWLQRESSVPRHWFSNYEILRLRRFHRHVLPDLLAAAQWKSQSEVRSARSCSYWSDLGAQQIPLHRRAALARFSGGVRAICPLGHAHVLGV